MGEWPIDPAQVYRTYETDGVPSSGFHWPDQEEIIQLFQAFGLPLETLSQDRDYYVNPSTGNDANTGATAGTAFQTPQMVANKAMEINFNGHFIQGNMADGTYSSGAQVTRALIGSPVEGLEFIGNGANPENVIIDNPVGFGFAATHGARYRVSNCKVKAVYNAYAEDAGSKITVANFLSDAIAAGNTVDLYARRKGEIQVKDSSVAFYGSGSHESLMQGTHGGTVWLDNANMIIAENLSVTIALAYALTLGEITAFGSAVAWSGAGTVTGKRYRARGNAVIQAIGKDANFFPGSIAGTTDEGGQYMTAPT
jgi:hypothetical protein